MKNFNKTKTSNELENYIKKTCHSLLGHFTVKISLFSKNSWIYNLL